MKSSTSNGLHLGADYARSINPYRFDGIDIFSVLDSSSKILNVSLSSIQPIYEWYLTNRKPPLNNLDIKCELGIHNESTFDEAILSELNAALKGHSEKYLSTLSKSHGSRNRNRAPGVIPNDDPPIESSIETASYIDSNSDRKVFKTVQVPVSQEDPLFASMEPYAKAIILLYDISCIAIQRQIWSSQTYTTFKQSILSHLYQDIPTQDTPSNSGRNSPLDSSHDATQAVTAYGRIKHKLRKLKQLELTCVRQQYEIFEILQYLSESQQFSSADGQLNIKHASQLKKISPPESDLLLELMMTALETERNTSIKKSEAISFGSKSVSSKGGSLGLRKGKQCSNISQMKKKPKETREELLSRVQLTVDAKCEFIRRQQEIHQNEIIHEIVFWKWLTIATKDVIQSASLRSSSSLLNNIQNKEPTSNEDNLQVVQLLNSKRCIDMFGHLHGHVKAIISSGDIPLIDLRNLIRLEDSKLCGHGGSRNRPLVKDTSNLEYLLTSLQLYNEEDDYANIIIPGVTGTLEDIRTKHKEMLQKVAHACIPFSPFDIVIS